jgi:hypothetical protein
VITIDAPPPPLHQPHQVTQSPMGQYSSAVITGADASLRQAELDRQLAAAVRAALAPGWDGAGSRPVSSASVVQAQHFLAALPAMFPAPEVSADPDGEIAFEWYVGTRQVFSVSIGDQPEIAYAGTFGAKRTWGSEPFLGELPGEVLRNLRRLYPPQA